MHAIGRLIRLLALWVDFAVFTAVMYLLAFARGVVPGGLYFRLFRVWCRTFVRALDVDLRLHQQYRGTLPEQYILVANHPSAFEDIGIPALFPVHSLAKIEVRDWWIVGRISAAAGTLYVERESRESRKAAAQRILDELAAGSNVAIYPEGGCKGRRVFSEFRWGAFDASLKSGVPVLPVFLHYESQDDFEWRAPQTLLHKIWHMLRTRNNRANYYVYDALDPADYDDPASFAEHTRQLFLGWQRKYLE